MVFSLNDFDTKKLVLATKNKGKVKELSLMLAPYGTEVLSANDVDFPDVEEDGLTFLDNAAKKARAGALATGLPTLADDSGLEVEALGGQPGIYSARFAIDGDYMRAMKALYDAALAKNDLRARFTCVLVLALPNQEICPFEGRVDGHLVWPPKGENGFGYDPFFVPEGYNDTFGVLPDEVKNKISHRARAFEKFVSLCF